MVPKNFFGYYPHALYRAGSYTVYKRHCHQLQVPKEDRVDLLPFATSVSNVLIICESEDFEESVGAKRRRAISDAVETTEEQAEGNLAKRRRIPTRGIPEEARYDGVNQWPLMVEASQMKRCRVCSNLTQNFCMKCDLYLCIARTRNYYSVFHKQ